LSVAIIPARGGSKRIPKKNIKNFCGREMIAYSIEAARRSGCFDRVLVSTDDAEIAAVAKRYGAEVPFIRPSKLSDDFATTSEVMGHAIKWLDQQSYDTPFVCCIYATAPFVSEKDLQLGYERLVASEDVDFVFSASAFPSSIYRAIEVDDRAVRMLNPEYAAVRSQDLPDAYHDAGQFYWGRKSAFIRGGQIFTKSSRVVLVPRERVQDIDTPADWEFAETLFYAMESRKNQ
jgi:pseudaminic acid cytidylyltransferase